MAFVILAPDVSPSKRVNGVRYADAFDGETSGARITNAIDDLP